ncbi:hypothetical protein C0039_10345 [Pseudohalioglobus lutimaris]|uniref:Uncharacterized protein n=2 Tax=Pseudohalioglobus lutimaris TaxID=1737061 RepID=A0A2N5X3E4_9GAMM|nr:hypothetical protein C0039_10345 [Pseudohalioglobus lutimaris]
MSREQFLTIAVNLLHRAFMQEKRTKAKSLFRDVAEGKMVPLTNVQMEDKSTVRFDLSLDHSEYGGSLNFGAFRNSLTTLLGNLANAVQEKREISTFSAEGNVENMIFGVTGVTVERDVPSVMVLSANIGGRDAAVQLRLMYLDYQQFLLSQQQDDDGEASTAVS